MRHKTSGEETLLLLYFTPDELAALTPEGLKLLAMLEHEELPDMPPDLPEDERLRQVRDYKERVLDKLKDQPTLPPDAT